MVNEVVDVISLLQTELDGLESKGIETISEEAIALRIVIGNLKKRYGPEVIDRIEGDDGRCPLCGAEIEYEGDQEIVDDCSMVSFTCPHCGASGKAGYDLMFDAYYDVEKGDG